MSDSELFESVALKKTVYTNASSGRFFQTDRLKRHRMLRKRRKKGVLFFKANQGLHSRWDLGGHALEFD